VAVNRSVRLKEHYGTTIGALAVLNTLDYLCRILFPNYGAANISALTKVGTASNIGLPTNTDAAMPPTVLPARLWSARAHWQSADGSADGTLTSGGVTISNGATLAFDRSDNYTITITSAMPER